MREYIESGTTKERWRNVSNNSCRDKEIEEDDGIVDDIGCIIMLVEEVEVVILHLSWCRPK